MGYSRKKKSRVRVWVSWLLIEIHCGLGNLIKVKSVMSLDI
jgi:hypothetical protein